MANGRPVRYVLEWWLVICEEYVDFGAGCGVVVVLVAWVLVTTVRCQNRRGRRARLLCYCWDVIIMCGGSF